MKRADREYYIGSGFALIRAFVSKFAWGNQIYVHGAEPFVSYRQ
jgi:hypothetical protein